MSHPQKIYDEKKTYGDEQIDHIERQQSPSEDLYDNLSGIEETAASKAAWLISITVSIGGFLFGKKVYNALHV